jgi:hypothetical protein
MTVFPPEFSSLDSRWGRDFSKNWLLSALTPSAREAGIIGKFPVPLLYRKTHR